MGTLQLPDGQVIDLPLLQVGCLSIVSGRAYEGHLSSHCEPKCRMQLATSFWMYANCSQGTGALCSLPTALSSIFMKHILARTHICKVAPAPC